MQAYQVIAGGNSGNNAMSALKNLKNHLDKINCVEDLLI